MADVVNSTHKSALSTRNQESSHLNGGSYETLGGPALYGGGPESYKIDAAKGVGTDSTIPKAVPAEASHLKTEEAEDDVEVSFDDDDEIDVDELDEALDDFEPVKVDVDMKEEDEKDEDDLVKEEDEKDDDKENPFVKEEDEKGEDNDKDNPFVKEEDEKDEKDNPFVKEEDEKDDKDNPFVKEEDDKDEDDKEPVSESVKIRVQMPKANLFESVNISKKSQAKLGVVLEAVIKNNTRQISEQLHRHYKKLHEQRIAQRDAVLAQKVDSYLSYVVETWVKENRPAIRQSLRGQLAENFLNGLQKLFRESYVDVPESKIDVVKKLNEELTATRTALNEQVGKTLKMRKLAEAANKARIVTDFARKNNLSEEQGNVLNTLVENVTYTTAKEFRQKLGMLKESYFTKKGAKSTLTEETIVEAPKPATPVSDDADVAAIAAIIDRSVKSSGY